jgi:hypothetical protein
MRILVNAYKQSDTANSARETERELAKIELPREKHCAY